MGRILGITALAFAGACAWPATRMEPVYNYGSGPKVTVSSAPAYNAGPSTAHTTSPDGATLFVCDGGGTRPGWEVPPDYSPAC
jgi:hypothetical protein